MLFLPTKFDDYVLLNENDNENLFYWVVDDELFVYLFDIFKF